MQLIRRGKDALFRTPKKPLLRACHTALEGELRKEYRIHEKKISVYSAYSVVPNANSRPQTRRTEAASKLVAVVVRRPQSLKKGGHWANELGRAPRSGDIPVAEEPARAPLCFCTALPGLPTTGMPPIFGPTPFRWQSGPPWKRRAWADELRECLRRFQWASRLLQLSKAPWDRQASPDDRPFVGES